MHMSKSGVFAHFGSREELQISVVREYFHRFEQEVFYPALRVPRGLPRVEALFANWMKRVASRDPVRLHLHQRRGGSTTGPGRCAMHWPSSVNTWLAAMRRAVLQAREEGHLRAGRRRDQMAFEIHGLILALHYEARFLNKPGLDRAWPRRVRPCSPALRRTARCRRWRTLKGRLPADPSEFFPGVFNHAYLHPPLRDMQFVMHEVLKVCDDFKACPAMPRSMPTPSTRCWSRPASSPPRWRCRSTSAATPKGCTLDPRPTR
jgi:AcrR family transcriptional regulator